ncbi:MAG: hypothetical protein KDK24_19640 [Pseudooceanicola sp.]|nr:hypothetical protein [Pseudooceanicola sp.]
MRLILALCATLLPGLAAAQTTRFISLPEAQSIDPATLTDAELLDLLDRLEHGRAPKVRRVSLFGIPAGFGAPRGVWFLSAAATNRRDRVFANDWDASFAVGFGLGDPVNGIGITPVIDFTSVSPHHFGESGKVGVKFSREMPFGPDWQGAIGLDIDNIATWGDSRVLDVEWTFSVSAVRPGGPGWTYPVMLSAGYGSAIDKGGNDPGWFAGAGIGLGETYGLSLGWYGDEAIGALNLWTGRNRNLQISLGIGDITDNVNGRRVLLAASFARPFRASNP